MRGARSNSGAQAGTTAGGARTAPGVRCSTSVSYQQRWSATAFSAAVFVCSSNRQSLLQPLGCPSSCHAPIPAMQCAQWQQSAPHFHALAGVRMPQSSQSSSSNAGSHWPHLPYQFRPHDPSLLPGHRVLSALLISSRSGRSHSAAPRSYASTVNPQASSRCTAQQPSSSRLPWRQRWIPPAANAAGRNGAMRHAGLWVGGAEVMTQLLMCSTCRPPAISLNAHLTFKAQATQVFD